MKNTSSSKKNSGKSEKSIKSNSLKKQQRDKVEYNIQELKYFKIIIIAALLLVIFLAPFYRGLYFETNQVIFEIIVFSIFAVFQIYNWICKKKTFLSSPIDYIIVVFVFIYFITIFAAVGPRLAVLEWLKYCMYLALFIMISQLAQDIKTRSYLIWTIILSALGLCMIGFEASGGGLIIEAANKFFEASKISFKFVDIYLIGRIFSTFGYPDTLAAYLLSIFILIQGYKPSINKKIVGIIANCIAFILFITILYTKSRGGILLIPIITLVYILFLAKGNRIRGIINLMVSIIPAVLLFMSEKLTAFMTATPGNEKGVFLWLLIGVIFTILLDLTSNKIKKEILILNLKVYISIGITILLVGVISLIIIFKTTVPIEISHAVGQAEGQITEVRNVELKPDTDYKLVISLKASSNEKDKEAYSIDINNYSDKSILFEGPKLTKHFQGKATNGIEEKNIDFKVPKDIKYVSLNFSNTYSGTSVKIYSIKLYDIKTGKIASIVPTKYKYIKNSIINKIKMLKYDSSVISRLMFYKDAGNIFKDHWLIGAGGKAWQVLYHSYQSYYYPSNETHSYITQLMVETGVLGLLTFLVLIITVITTYLVFVRKVIGTERKVSNFYAAIIASIIAIILHSIIDLDLSLSAVAFLLWILIALYNIELNMSLNKITAEVGIIKNRIIKVIVRIKKVELKSRYLILAACIFILIPVFFEVAIRYETKAYAAYKEKNIDKAIENMSIAGKLDPFKYQSKLDLANLIKIKTNINKEDVVRADEQIKKVSNLGYYDAKACSEIGSYYLKSGDVENAIKYFERSMKLNPLLPEQWEQGMYAYSQIIFYYFNNKDNNTAIKYIDKALELINELKEINSKKLLPIKFNDKTIDMIEKLKYIKDIYGKVSNLDISKLVFYNIGSMDVNMDGIPDQWDIVTPDAVKLLYKDGNMIAEGKYSKDIGIQTRALDLKNSMDYRIKIELSDSAAINEIPFLQSWDLKELKAAKESNNVYTATISTPAGEGSFQGRLLLNIINEYKIKSIIIEQLI